MRSKSRPFSRSATSTVMHGCEGGRAWSVSGGAEIMPGTLRIAGAGGASLARMPARRIRVAPASAMKDGFETVRREAAIPEDFPAAALAEAEAAARTARAGDRLDLPFVTIDPPGTRDLDQALHFERRGDGHRVRYAIADVASFVTPGGALDRTTHERGVTVYAPDANVPLHPPELSEGAASLLPAQWSPAVVWTLDLDATGELESTHVTRAQVRSVAQH